MLERRKPHFLPRIFFITLRDLNFKFKLWITRWL